jgi:hypothetical protein
MVGKMLPSEVVRHLRLKNSPVCGIVLRRELLSAVLRIPWKPHLHPDCQSSESYWSGYRSSSLLDVVGRPSQTVQTLNPSTLFLFESCRAMMPFLAVQDCYWKMRHCRSRCQIELLWRTRVSVGTSGRQDPMRADHRHHRRTARTAADYDPHSR